MASPPGLGGRGHLAHASEEAGFEILLEARTRLTEAGQAAGKDRTELTVISSTLGARQIEIGGTSRTAPSPIGVEM